MRCAEEQYKGLFEVLRTAGLPDDITFTYSYSFPQTMRQWDEDTMTFYVLAMNVRELARMLQQSRQKLPKYYAWWQTEQHSNTRFFSNAAWMRALSNAMWIWDYSEGNMQYLTPRVGQAVVTLVRHAFYEPTILHRPLPDHLLPAHSSPVESNLPAPTPHTASDTAPLPSSPSIALVATTGAADADADDADTDVDATEADATSTDAQKPPAENPSPPRPQPALTSRALMLQRRREAMQQRRLELQRQRSGDAKASPEMTVQQRAYQLRREAVQKRQQHQRALAVSRQQTLRQRRIPQASQNAALAHTDGPYDVLLLGALAGPTRTRTVQLLRTKYGLSVASPPRGRYWYAEERERQIRRAHVCINVHYFRTPSVLETARLNLLLANGSVIVSERSTSAGGVMDKRYEDAGAVLFVDQDDIEGLARLCKELATDEARRLEQQRKAVAFARSEEQSTQAHAKTVIDVLKLLYT